MHDKTKHAIRRGRRANCGVETMEPRTLLAAAVFGVGEIHLLESGISASYTPHISISSNMAAPRFFDDVAAPAMRPQHSHHKPVSPFDDAPDSMSTLAVVPASVPMLDPYAQDNWAADASQDISGPDNRPGAWRQREHVDVYVIFDWGYTITMPDATIGVFVPKFDSYTRGGNGPNENGNRNPGRGGNDTPLPRDGNSQTSARPGQTVIDAQQQAAGPANSSVLRLASSEVVKSIFSNDPIVQHTSPYNSAAAATPVIATTATEPGGRSILLYLSTVAGSAKPMLMTAKAAAAQVVGENAVHAAEAGTELAIASAASILPSPYRAVEIVRMGSPMMLVADSIGAVIEESVNMVNIATREQPQSNYRAWLVTGAVVAADLVLLTYCFYRRRQLQLVEAVVARRIYG